MVTGLELTKGNIYKSKDFVVAIFKKIAQYRFRSIGIAHFEKVLLCEYYFYFFPPHHFW